MRHTHVTSLTFTKGKKAAQPPSNPTPFFILFSPFYKLLSASAQFIFVLFFLNDGSWEIFESKSTGTVFQFKLRHFKGKKRKRVGKNYEEGDKLNYSQFFYFDGWVVILARKEEKEKEKSPGRRGVLERRNEQHQKLFGTLRIPSLAT